MGKLAEHSSITPSPPWWLDKTTAIYFRESGIRLLMACSSAAPIILGDSNAGVEEHCLSYSPYTESVYIFHKDKGNCRV